MGKDNVDLYSVSLRTPLMRSSDMDHTLLPANNTISAVSHYLGRHLSTWQMTAASCLTALSAFCGRLMLGRALYHEHTAAIVTELSQPLDLVCGTLYRSSCAIQTSPTDCLGDS